MAARSSTAVPNSIDVSSGKNADLQGLGSLRIMDEIVGDAHGDMRVTYVDT